jgi:hypothetical protein
MIDRMREFMKSLNPWAREDRATQDRLNEATEQTGAARALAYKVDRVINSYRQADSVISRRR